MVQSKFYTSFNSFSFRMLELVLSRETDVSHALGSLVLPLSLNVSLRNPFGVEKVLRHMGLLTRNFFVDSF